MTDFRILHVSDIHFGCPDADVEQGRITDALIEAALKKIRQDRRAPDLVIFSGDLAHSALQAQFEQGADWLYRLTQSFDCPAFIVPGNHDASRPDKDSEDYEIAYSLRAAVDTQKGYETARKQLLKRKHLDAFCTWHAADKARLRLCSDWSTSRLASAASFNRRRMTAHVIGLNTALASLDDGDLGNLVADVGQLNTLLHPIDVSSDLAIVVSHHPVSAVAGATERWLSQWNNDSLAELLGQQSGPHLYLHGHVHESKGLSVSSIDGSRIFAYGAGAAYQGSRWPQRFAFLDLDFGGMQIQPAVFEYHSRSGQWLPVAAQSHPVTCNLPRRGGRSLVGGSSRIVKVKKAVVPVIDLRGLEESISATGASRYVSRDVAADPVHFARLVALFDELVETTSHLSKPITRTVLDKITNKAAPHWSVVGEAGSGKAEFLAVMYWMLRQLPGEARVRGVFIDLEHWHRDAGNHHHDVLASLIRGAKGEVIVFVCGSMPVDAKNKAKNPAEELSRAGCVLVTARHERRMAPRKLTDHVVRVQTPMFDAALLDQFLEAVRPLQPFPVASDWKQFTGMLVATICATHRMPVSMFLVRECGIVADSQPAVATFSELMETRLVALSDGEPRWAVPELARRAFEAFRQRAHSASNRYESMLTLSEDCPSGLRRMLSSHPSVEHWLVAYHAQAMLETLGEESLKPPTSAKNDRLREICESLELVYPVHVNAFAKELFATALKSKHAEIGAALKMIFDAPMLGAGRLLRAHGCYLAGRLPRSARARDFMNALRGVASNAEQELCEIRALRAAAKLAVQLGAPKVRAQLETVAASMYGKGGVAAESDERLNRIGRELLLLQRSALISLAYLGDLEAAQDYIGGLLSDADKDDMNRGFHLEYYGDVEYQPGRPLLSTDVELLPCPNSFASLIDCLGKSSTSPPLAAIQAVTLASLARHRHAKGCLDAEARGTILKCLIAALKCVSELSEVCEFLNATIAELKNDQFVVERYVDGLYELKYQRRAGWGNIHPPESVAAHSYFVELLAKLFVPDKGLDHTRVLRLVALHDLAEAITGDIPHNDRTEKAKKRETRVVRRIAHLGALTGSSDLLSLSDDYNVFEGRDKTDETVVAQDLDRLDLLIQLMRYRREDASMARYAEFRNYVEPETFGSLVIREWAARFLRYYDTQIAEGADYVQGTQSVWPEPLNVSRI